MRADQGQVDAAKVNLSYTRIVAPISGRVGLRQIDAGNYVQTGETTGIVVITQLQPITVIFTVPEDNLPDITRRLRTGEELPVTALDRTASRLLATGRLTTVDNQIDTTTGTVKLRAEFANEDEALFPNQFVNVELLVDTLKGAVTVPVPAVQRGAPGTFVYPAADIKTPPLMHLSLNARVAVREIGERMSELLTGGFVVTRHLAELGRNARDYVSVAEQLIGTPYLWGGKTRIGLDCSGLVQLALQAAGIAAPRDSDMQQSELGEEVLVPKSLEGLLRGDLVFWKGHVGLMADGIMLIHANAHHMATVTETLPEAAERIARAGSEIIAVKRIGGGVG